MTQRSSSTLGGVIEVTDDAGQLLARELGQGQGGLWVHASQPSADELERLQAAFPMNKLALNDALEDGHPSHYSNYPEGDVVTFRSLAQPLALSESSERLTLFVYPDRLLTVSLGPVSYLARVRAALAHDPALSAGEVAFQLLDAAASSYTQFVHTLEDRIDALELGMFEERKEGEGDGAQGWGGASEQAAGRRLVQTIFGLKQRLTQARRLCLEAQDALVLLARHASATEADLLRYRDVRDSMNRLCRRLDTSRDNLTTLLSIYSSVQSQRMNEVMRTLAAVSTIFLPLTFLAGVWGMNFQHMPELHWRFGYLVAWASFALVAGALAWVFKRRGWW